MDSGFRLRGVDDILSPDHCAYVANREELLDRAWRGDFRIDPNKIAHDVPYQEFYRQIYELIIIQLNGIYENSRIPGIAYVSLMDLSERHGYLIECLSNTFGSDFSARALELNRKRNSGGFEKPTLGVRPTVGYEMPIMYVVYSRAAESSMRDVLGNYFADCIEKHEIVKSLDEWLGSEGGGDWSGSSRLIGRNSSMEKSVTIRKCSTGQFRIYSSDPEWTSMIDKCSDALKDCEIGDTKLPYFDLEYEQEATHIDLLGLIETIVSCLDFDGSKFSTAILEKFSTIDESELKGYCRRICISLTHIIYGRLKINILINGCTNLDRLGYLSAGQGAVTMRIIFSLPDDKESDSILVNPFLCTDIARIIEKINTQSRSSI